MHAGCSCRSVLANSLALLLFHRLSLTFPTLLLHSRSLSLDMVQTPDGKTTRFLTHAIFSPSARPSPYASSSMLVPVLWWRPHTVKSSLACASLRQSRYASLVVWTCVAYAVFSLSLGAYGGGHWARIPSSWCLGFRINRFPVIDLGLLFPHVSGVD